MVKPRRRRASKRTTKSTVLLPDRLLGNEPERLPSQLIPSVVSWGSLLEPSTARFQGSSLKA
jgi:hypothetical protein